MFRNGCFKNQPYKGATQGTLLWIPAAGYKNSISLHQHYQRVGSCRMSTNSALEASIRFAVLSTSVFR